MITLGENMTDPKNISNYLSSRGFIVDERGILHNSDGSLAEEGFGLNLEYRINGLHNKLNKLSFIRALSVEYKELFKELNVVKEIISAIGVYDVEYGFKVGLINNERIIEVSKRGKVHTWYEWMGDYKFWKAMVSSDRVRGRIYVLLSDEGVAYLNSLLPAKL